MDCRLTIPMLLAASLACSALARQPATEAKPAQPPAPAQPPQPSLDDLLGLPKDKPKPADKDRPAAADPTKTELERKLAATEIADQFKQAVQLMGETAERLQSAKDTGLATQRLQEDIIRKLDQLIKSAEQNQKQSKSSQSQQQRDKQQQQPNQQQSQRNPDGKEAAPDTLTPPPGQQANPAPGVAARGAAWGALPTRVRDALLQGNEDKYSALYQKWTEAYYRRLAEDANK
jgi:hypothetical protein